MELDLIGQDISNLRQVDWNQATRYNSINLHFNRLTNLRGLPPLTNIVELNLSSNHFKSCGLPELASLPNLMTLDLSGNKIASLRHLPYLPTLRNLSVAFNFITSLEHVHESVPNLEQLDVRGNQIARSVDLDALAELGQLRVLFIGGPQQNPVCSRIPNMTRLFQICESLQLIDEKTASEWRNIQLLDAPTPKFDELLKQRQTKDAVATSASKRQAQLMAQQPPSSSHVLFPRGEAPGGRSPRFFEFDDDAIAHSPSSDAGHYHRPTQHGGRGRGPPPQHGQRRRLPSHQSHHSHQSQSDYYDSPQQAAAYAPSYYSRSYDDEYDGEYDADMVDAREVPLRRPSNASSTGLRTNPWSAASHSESEAPAEASPYPPRVPPPTETIVGPRAAVGNEAMSPAPETSTASKLTSPRKGSLTIQVTDEDGGRIDGTAARPGPASGASGASTAGRYTPGAAPFASPNSGSSGAGGGAPDADFRKEEHQLSLRLVSTLMTLTAMNEKQAFAQKVQAFSALKLHVMASKWRKRLEAAEAETEAQRLETQRLEQEQRSARANFEQRLFEEQAKQEAMAFQQRQQEVLLQDAQRSVERLQTEKEAVSAERQALVEELVEVRQQLEDATLRVAHGQAKELQHHQELRAKDEAAQRLQESLQQATEQLQAHRQELDYCQHRLRVQDEAAASYKTSVEVLQETIRAKDDALVLRAHELEVLKKKLAQLEQEVAQDAQERSQSLHVLRQDVVDLTAKNETLQRQVEEFESRRLESRLLTLQAAFDEISQHNLDLQKEVLDKTAQHQQDRKVMKELSRCIKKLQEIDAYRKHLPCAQCQTLQQTVAERDGQLDRLRHDLVQLQHDYQELRRRDDSASRQQLQQQANVDAQKQGMLEQLSKLEAAMRDIDSSKHELETQLQVKDVMLGDQRLQIDDLRRRLRASDDAAQSWREQKEESEAQVEELRREVAVLEREVSVKTQIAQRVKRIIREYLRQELRRQERELDARSDDDGEDDDDDAQGDGRWSRARLSRSIELLSVPEGGQATRRAGRATASADDDDAAEEEPQSERDREKQWALKRLRNAVQHAQGFDAAATSSSSRGSASVPMDDAEFLRLLEDIDGIALAQSHARSAPSSSSSSSSSRRQRSPVGKPPRPQSTRYADEDDARRDDEGEGDDGSDEDADGRQDDRRRSRGASRNAATTVCQNVQCQQQRAALEKSLEDAYRRLSQQRVDFEAQLAKKSEEYQRVSESLSRLEEKSQELGRIIASEKERYEVSVEKFRLDKKKLSKACRALEDELKKKTDELEETKAATAELQQAFAAFQKLQAASKTVGAAK